MATTGAKIAGTGTSVARGSNTAWTNPGNITANDNTTASCSSGSTGTAYLRASNFGFSIPTGSVINGVTVVVEMAESSAGTEAVTLQLVDDTATAFGTTDGFTANGATLTLYTTGSSTSKWGATLTPAILNDTDFGVYLWYTTAHNTTVDYISIDVDYTPPATGSISVTESGSDTASVNGDVIVQGSFAVTASGSDTAAINGTVVYGATLGSLAATETGSDAAALSGNVPVSGDLAATESGSDTSSLAGLILVNGSLAVQETGSDGIALNGQVVVTGTLDATETGSDTAEIDSRIPPALGSINATETGSDAAALSASVLVSASLSAAETQSDTLDASGVVPISGYVVATDSQDTLAGAGTVLIEGSAGASESGNDSAAIFGSTLSEIIGSLQASESGSDTAEFRPPVEKKKTGGGRSIGYFVPVRDVTFAVSAPPGARAKARKVFCLAAQNVWAFSRTPSVRGSCRSVSVSRSESAVASRNGARSATRFPLVTCGTGAVTQVATGLKRQTPLVKPKEGQSILAGMHGAKHGAIRIKVKAIVNPSDEELIAVAAAIKQQRLKRLQTLTRRFM